MNLLNEKAKVLRVQLEAEKGKENPSWYRIQKLEEELDKVLSILM